MRRLKAFQAQLLTGPLPYLLGVSVIAYAALWTSSVGGAVAALCGRISVQALIGYLAALPWALGLGRLITDWGLMVVAMMTPLVSLQVARILWSSRPAGRPGAVSCFLLAYWGIWALSGLILIPVALIVSSTLGTAALMATLAAALMYSASPVAQRARNRCHRADPIPAFGVGIMTRSARAGLITGANCIGACWPWMLVPVMVQSYHFTAMIFVGLYLFADRIAPPAPPRWQRPPGIETLLGSYRPFARLRRLLRPDG